MNFCVYILCISLEDVGLLFSSCHLCFIECECDNALSEHRTRTPARYSKLQWHGQISILSFLAHLFGFFWLPFVVPTATPSAVVVLHGYISVWISVFARFTSMHYSSTSSALYDLKIIVWIVIPRLEVPMPTNSNVNQPSDKHKQRNANTYNNWCHCILLVCFKWEFRQSKSMI